MFKSKHHNITINLYSKTIITNFIIITKEINMLPKPVRNLSYFLFHFYIRSLSCLSNVDAGDPCTGVTCPAGARCVAAYGQAECRCPRSCQRRKPVCGTDGREYSSVCHLDKHACDNQFNITIKYHGKCGKFLKFLCLFCYIIYSIIFIIMITLLDFLK